MTGGGIAWLQPISGAILQQLKQARSLNDVVANLLDAADSIVLATAREYKAKIMTSNEHFRDLVGE